MAELGRAAKDYDYVILHQPNAKFPRRAAAMLGFETAQWETGLLCPVIGNTYSGAAMLALTAVPDVAHPGQRILTVSFGPAAGSDPSSLVVTERIAGTAEHAPTTHTYLHRRAAIDYAAYHRSPGHSRLK